ncbi:hydroxyethylthiazole kinase-like sugar kinase family protein [Paenibacillus sp. SORGH_AS338]|nr:hydroxyethylthiazole kinase-like sugar kinase family protein [Paenibacillus sp. SORGH_AS_0338]
MKKDVVTDGQNTYTIANSHQILTQVTGGGCLLSAVVGAFIAVADPTQAQERLEAVTEALAFYGIAAEIAYEQTAGQGTGSFQMQFINQLSLVTPEIVIARAQITSSKA